ncbi:MAG: 16S rRNA processing protein RimM [Fibrobacter sp.]|nr:16S rRNA processing protein RimM [Fibrobacter sp.]
MQRNSELNDLVAVGFITRTVGLEGLVGIEPSGFVLGTLELPYTLYIGVNEKECEEIVLEDLDERPNTFVGLFEGVDSIESAELLKGKHIYIAKADLPELEENEYYHFELVGMKVLTDNGIELGTVIHVHNFPSADTIEISRKRGDALLVPLTKESVVSIDKDSRQITLKYDFVEELL